MLPALLATPLLALLLLAGARPAVAQVSCTTPEPVGQVVYDTYQYGPVPGGPAREPDRAVGVFGNNNYNWQYADPFAPEVGGRLDALTLCLRTTPLAGAPGTPFVVRFREDEGGRPGAVLEDWIVPVFAGALRNIELVSQLRPALSDGSVYWINVASNSDTGSGSWAVAATPNIYDWLAAQTRVEDPAAWIDPTGSILKSRGMALVEVPEPGRRWQAGSAALALALLVGLRRRRSDHPSLPH